MGDPRPVAVLAVVLAAAWNVPHAMAAPDDAFQKAKTEAMETVVDQRRPFGGMTTVAARTRNWSVNTFYVAWTGSETPRTPYWIVRRAIGSSLKGPAVQWADSRSCPAVRPVLEDLQALRAPLPDIPGVGPARELVLTADGESHDLWLNWAIYPNDARGDLRMSGNVDSPVAAWWQAALPTLKTCWSGTAPG